ncbi:hypothetical protein CDT99_03700 [Cronobacter sakazakii]|nr:hypothetical protein CDT99_03700 [Cronobacter sakazakii]
MLSFVTFYSVIHSCSVAHSLPAVFFDLSLSEMGVAKLTVISAAYIQHISPFNRFSSASRRHLARPATPDC